MTYTEQQLTAAVVSQGLRPALALPKSGVPSVLLSLIQRCWDSDPEKRPSFENIIDELNIIQKHLVSSACLPSWVILIPLFDKGNSDSSVTQRNTVMEWLADGEDQ